MPTNRIDFDGDWTPDEQRLLTHAIEDAEALEGRRTAGPWTCYCKRLDGLTVYVAHRSGWPRVLHAYGATELSFKILFFGQEHEACFTA